MLVRTSPSRRTPCRNILGIVLLAAGALLTGQSSAQRVQPQPVTDSSAQASPLAPVPRAPVTDLSAQASPVTPLPTGGPSIPAHTAIPITLGESIDSGRVKQGQNVQAQLTAPIALHGGATLPAGTPVVLSVIAAVPAGRIAAQGELSLQVVHVGNLPVYTDTLVFEGKPGHQDLPDSAPALGTDAGLPSGSPLTFHVQPPPTFAEDEPQQRDNGPGSVNGVAVGAAPPPTALKSTYGDPNAPVAGGQTSGQQQRSVSPGDTTTNQGTQSLGQTSVAPNQPQSPGRTSPSPTTKP